MHILTNPYLEEHMMAGRMATYYSEAVFVFSMIMKSGDGVQAEDRALNNDGYSGAMVHWSVQ